MAGVDTGRAARVAVGAAEAVIAPAARAIGGGHRHAQDRADQRQQPDQQLLHRAAACRQAVAPDDEHRGDQIQAQHQQDQQKGEDQHAAVPCLDWPHYAAPPRHWPSLS
ncbi:hypothetical protein G6F50_018257 [Rhizopus delemar]|uniref:Uncharacterized protein n=1 Tax=Rhizopus delemar TaxID=936053 RepID=A0A9P7BZL9_9FUNG|nr:hypothetical protein G6F50_018257 [Rhizopus delemar]